MSQLSSSQFSFSINAYSRMYLPSLYFWSSLSAAIWVKGRLRISSLRASVNSKQSSRCRRPCAGLLSTSCVTLDRGLRWYFIRGKVHRMEEIGSAVLSSKRFGDEFSKRAEVGATLAADINIVSLQELYEYLWHYNDYDHSRKKKPHCL